MTDTKYPDCESAERHAKDCACVVVSREFLGALMGKDREIAELVEALKKIAGSHGNGGNCGNPTCNCGLNCGNPTCNCGLPDWDIAKEALAEYGKAEDNGRHMARSVRKP